MTEPTEPADPTGEELDSAIFAAARALIAARFSRNPDELADARTEYDRLLALKKGDGDD